MYSDKKNILQLVALLRAHEVTRIVLCPGSRNSPIIHTLSNHPDFTCYAMTDERSAGFFALGLSLSDDKPVAVCCTSGSALLNIHPAVAEAFYQKVPLVVISADRPAAWIGQMDGQTLPQPGVFQTLVKKSVNLPEIYTDEDEWYCNRLINEALLEMIHHEQGPVHINIPISEPLFRFTVKSLPKVRVIKRYQELNYYDNSIDELLQLLKAHKKRMFVVGQTHYIRLFNERCTKVMSSHFVWLAEHISNQVIPGNPIKNFDAMLYAMSEDEKKQMAPELLITYGGHIVSKRLKEFLRQNPPKEHWHISEDGEVVDLYGSLTSVIELDPFLFIDRLSFSLNNRALKYPNEWNAYSQMIPEPNFAYSEMSALGSLLKKLPKECTLHLANSSVVRYAQLYSIPSTVEVICNRGTSGIEGSLSAAIGYAANSDYLNFVAIGDLSFFYDMNALWCGNIHPNLRILLLNNGGGEIFHTLPGLDASQASHKFISALHTTSAKGWVEERGFIYQKVENEAQLDEAMGIFTQIEPLKQPIIVEVFTNQDEDTLILKDYYHQLKQK